MPGGMSCSLAIDGKRREASMDSRGIWKRRWVPWWGGGHGDHWWCIWGCYGVIEVTLGKLSWSQEVGIFAFALSLLARDSRFGVKIAGNRLQDETI